MGHAEAAGLLRRNLEQEERFAQELEKLDKALGEEAAKQPRAGRPPDREGVVAPADRTGPPVPGVLRPPAASCPRRGRPADRLRPGLCLDRMVRSFGGATPRG